HILSSRPSGRTTTASMRIAVDLVRRRIIDEKTALLRVDPSRLDDVLHPTFDPRAVRDVVARGSGTSPGAAAGRIAFSAEEAERRSGAGEPILLVRHETDAADIAGMHVSQGIITSKG